MPNLLDLGCGAGDFPSRLRQAGFGAWGIDISSKAVALANPFIKPYLAIGRLGTRAEAPAAVVRTLLATAPAYATDPVETIHVVTAVDFWEHIWNDEAPDLVRAVWGLLPPGGVHFAVICTKGKTERDYVFPRGVKVTPENGWVLVSGHVNIRSWRWWARLFRRCGFKLRHDLMNMFGVARAEDPGLSQVASWSARNVLAVEKV